MRTPYLSTRHSHRNARRGYNGVSSARPSRGRFAATRAVCQILQGDEIRTGSAFHKTLWTALAVVYVRPFLDSNEVGRVPKSIHEVFATDRMRSINEMLFKARHRTFAHTGVHPAHAVWVFPPESMSANGSSTVGDIPFGSAELPEIEELCVLQDDRARAVPNS